MRFIGRLISCRIGDGIFTQLISGQSPESEYYNYEGKGLPFYQGKTDFGEINPIPTVWCTKPKKVAEPQDVLLSVRAPVGPVNVANEKCCIGRGLAAIRCLAGLDYRFLYWQMRRIEQDFESHGSTFDSIDNDKIREIEIVFPEDLAEQLSFIEEYEKEYTSFVVARNAVDRQRDAVKILRSAILREAFPWKPGEILPTGWHWEKLAECCDFKNGVNYSAADIDGEVKIIGVSDFQDYSRVRTESLAKISSRAVGVADYLAPNDIVVVRSNGNPELVGRHMLFVSDEPVTHSGFTIRLRLNPQRIWPELYLLYAKSPKFREQVKGQGANISNLSQTVLKKVAVPVPDTLAGQMALVKKLQRKIAALGRLRVSEQREREAVEALPAAILREAFDFERQKA